MEYERESRARASRRKANDRAQVCIIISGLCNFLFWNCDAHSMCCVDRNPRSSPLLEQLGSIQQSVARIDYIVYQHNPSILRVSLHDAGFVRPETHPRVRITTRAIESSSLALLSFIFTHSRVARSGGGKLLQKTCHACTAKRVCISPAAAHGVCCAYDDIEAGEISLEAL
jgi:hypothetical protein